MSGIEITLMPFFDAGLSASPGLDWVSFTATNAANLVLDSYAGKLTPARIEENNQKFQTQHKTNENKKEKKTTKDK